MMWLAWSLRRSLDRSIKVRRVQYQKRGWNSPELDAVRDAEAALSILRRDVASDNLVLVGHSMGARVAVHLAARHSVRGVVALAPWWPSDDADLVPTSCSLLTIHGTADTWTSPSMSLVQTTWARDRGVDAQWVGLPDAGHHLMRDFHKWHRLTSEFAAKALNAEGASS
jgi:pimeloyl-ACP methyl ester carboxylesterase